MISRHIRSLKRAVLGGWQREWAGRFCTPSHPAAGPVSNCRVPHYHPDHWTHPTTIVPVDEQQHDYMYTCVVIFFFPFHFPLFRMVLLFWRKSKTTWLFFPFSRQHWADLTHPKMGGLRGTFAPALYSTISSPLVLGPKSCFGAHSHQNPALRIADGLRARPASCGDTKRSLKILTSM